MRRLLILCLVGAAGCPSPQYYYQPAELADATVGGYPAARYGIPPERPQGDVRIATFGFATLELRTGETVPALHLRMIVSNSGGSAVWALDTRDVAMDLDGFGVVRAAFSNGDAPGLPVVQIPPGEDRTIDLYFRLPPDMEDARDVPRFSVLWRVRTDQRIVSERTPFDRIRIIEEVTPGMYYGAGIGIGRYWWHDPFVYPRPIVVYRVRPRTRFLRTR